MTPMEVAHRTLRAMQARAERSGIVKAPAMGVPDLSFRGKPWISARPQVDPARYVAAAEKAADAHVDVFALGTVDLGMPPRWNRDPKTGIEAPLSFGKTLDYRNSDLVGDVKYLWEPNRHLHLVTLAQAWALTGKRSYIDALETQLDSWFLACPFGRGPNWSAALEAGIRLVNWSVVWQLAAKGCDEDFRRRWLRSIYEHAHFVRHFFSAHSSANNHLIGEAIGLYVAGTTWPHWPEMREWAAAAKRILAREALAQNAPDGVNREHAAWYQHFVAEMLVTAMLAARAAGDPFPNEVEARIEAMLDFVASIMDAGGNVPMFGDADDGHLLRLDPSPDYSPFRSLLSLGALLFRRGDFKEKAKSLDDRARWLYGEDADAAWQALDPEATHLPLRQTFPDGGFYVLGASFDTPREIRAVVDAGPLGYTSIAAFPAQWDPKLGIHVT